MANEIFIADKPTLDAVKAKTDLVGVANPISGTTTIMGYLCKIYDDMLTSIGAVKSIQRGVAASAGTITISEVNINKTVVFSKSKGSAGTVATNSTIPQHKVLGVTTSENGLPWTNVYFDSSCNSNYVTPLSASVTLTGGSTNLIVKEYSAKLVSSTQISCDGPVEWQVVEFR
ncbi:hypothetical protein [Syntrophomonas curvata]